MSRVTVRRAKDKPGIKSRRESGPGKRGSGQCGYGKCNMIKVLIRPIKMDTPEAKFRFKND